MIMNNLNYFLQLFTLSSIYIANNIGDDTPPAMANTSYKWKEFRNMSIPFDTSLRDTKPSFKIDAQ